MNILQVGPPHLSDVTTLPCEIQIKVIFNSTIHNTSDHLCYRWKLRKEPVVGCRR